MVLRLADVELLMLIELMRVQLLGNMIPNLLRLLEQFLTSYRVRDRADDLLSLSVVLR